MPALVSFTVVVLIPMLIGFFYAFTNWNGIVGSEIRFVLNTLIINCINPGGMSGVLIFSTRSARAIIAQI